MAKAKAIRHHKQVQTTHHVLRFTSLYSLKKISNIVRQRTYGSITEILVNSIKKGKGRMKRLTS